MACNTSFYRYSVTWYCESMVTNHGILAAKDFSDAMDQINEGFDNIENVYLACINDCWLLDFEELTDYFKGEDQTPIGQEIITALKEAIDSVSMEKHDETKENSASCE